jgi:hypothetical protein
VHGSGGPGSCRSSREAAWWAINLPTLCMSALTSLQLRYQLHHPCAGLEGRPQLNNREGVIDGPVSERAGRWEVQLRTPEGLRDGPTISISEAKLQVISGPQPTGCIAAKVCPGHNCKAHQVRKQAHPWDIPLQPMQDRVGHTRGIPAPLRFPVCQVPVLVQPQCMLLRNLGCPLKTSVQMPLGQQNLSAHWRVVDPWCPAHSSLSSCSSMHPVSTPTDPQLLHHAQLAACWGTLGGLPS